MFDSSSSAAARRRQRTACPYPSVAPASTMMPILVSVLTGPLDEPLPGFQNRNNFVFKNVADGNPVAIFLSRDQLCERALEHGRSFLAGNFCIRGFCPSKIFGKNREENPNRIEKLCQLVMRFFFLAVFQQANDFAR